MNHRKVLRVVKVLCVFLVLSGVGVEVTIADNATSDRIPDVLVYSDAGAKDYAVIVEKESQRLFLYAFDGTNRVIFRMKCSTGESDGAKTRSGDKKTPVGVYFFVKEHKDRELSPIYGSRAFPMDYPNLLDQLAGRDGNAIWLHGTNKPLKPRDSNGCVALDNPEIDRLSEFIRLNRTPIIVVEKLSYTKADSAAREKESIFDFLSAWTSSLAQGTYQEYLMFYDPNYLPDISWWPEWYRLNKTNGVSPAPFSLALEKKMIVKQGAVFVALFDQVVKSSDRKTDGGTRKLFISSKGNRLKIVGDVYQVRPGKKEPLVAAALDLKKASLAAAALDLKKASLAAVSKEEEKKPEETLDIPEMINAWLDAWSSKDIQAYGSYYSKNFKSQGGAGLDSWLKYKSRINRKYKYIRVKQRKLSVQKGNRKSIATFVQDYESSGFRTVGFKKLILIREKGQWKIYRETWKKS